MYLRERENNYFESTIKFEMTSEIARYGVQTTEYNHYVWSITRMFSIMSASIVNR
jgi:hypothetical protein